MGTRLELAGSNYYKACMRPWIVALCSLVSSVLTGQVVLMDGPVGPQNSTGKRYPISGIVLNSITNEPIRRALVRVSAGPQQYAAFTGGDGRFQVASVPEGTVSLSAERPGYFDPRSVSGTPFPRANTNTQVTSGTNDFKVFLTPEAKLAGTVLDADGDPIERLQVIIHAQQIAQGRKQWVTRAFGNTDESGVFRVEGQVPGTVVVCTVARPVEMFTARSRQVYPSRCFPNTSDFASAQGVELMAGQETRTDMTLSSVPGFAVSGVVRGGPSTFGAIWVDTVGSQGGPHGNGQVNPGTGRFMIRAMPNGTATLHFQANDTQGNAFEAYQEVAVNGADVSGLQVNLQRAAEIPVEVRYLESSASQTPVQNGPQAPQNPGAVQIRLVPTADEEGRQYYSSQGPNANAESGAAPSIAVRGVPPGTYGVHAQPIGNGCVDSVSFGSADLSREPLIVSAGAAPLPILVTLRTDCPTLEVRLQSSGVPETGIAGVIIIAPESALGEPLIIGLPGNGSSSLTNLSAGGYRVYAVSDLEGLEYANPQAMRSIESQTVNLTPGQKTSLNLQVVKRNQ